MAKEEYYRRKFSLLLRKLAGGFVFHPPDFAGIKNKQADLLWFPAKPVLIELKRWNLKRTPWSIKREFRRNPKQVQFYTSKVQEGFRVFYVIYYVRNRHKSSIPDVIWSLHESRRISLQKFLSEILSTSQRDSSQAIRITSS